MRVRQLCCLLVLSLLTCWLAARPGEEGSLITEIRSHREGVRIWWMGHNAWLIKSGELLFSTDLVLQDPEREWQAPISPQELGPELDISFVTHEHGDHFHRPTSKALVQQSRCWFVLPESCLDAATELGIPEERVRLAKPGQPFQIEGVRVEPIRAIHGNRDYAVYEKANLMDCGYLFEVGGKRILQPGDSVLLEDQLFLENVDVLFVSPTVHNTHIDRSVILINRLEPDFILPQHRDTYRETPENSFWTHGYHLEVKWLLPPHLQDRYRVLNPAEGLQIH